MGNGGSLNWKSKGMGVLATGILSGGMGGFLEGTDISVNAQMN